MDWQIIILTLGASLITGSVSLLGNIIVSKGSLKKALAEEQVRSKKEFVKQKIKVYDEINIIMVNLTNESSGNPDFGSYDNLSLLKSTWLSNYHYISKEVSRLCHILFFSRDKNEDSQTIERSLFALRKQIKEEVDSYYDNKEKDKMGY